MKIDKSLIIDVLKQRGEDDQAARADSELPDSVDTDRHFSILSLGGIDLGELLGGAEDTLDL